jgi:hypothetical protein
MGWNGVPGAGASAAQHLFGRGGICIQVTCGLRAVPDPQKHQVTPGKMLPKLTKMSEKHNFSL